MSLRSNGSGERRAFLNRAADVPAAKAGEFAELMITETGGTVPWAGLNTMLSGNTLREAASMITQIQGEIIPSDKPGTLAMSIRQPAGVCLDMHVTIGKVFVEAGFPDGVVNVIANAPQDAAAVIEALIAAPEVRRVNFTGSTKVGRIVGELSSSHLKPALL